MCAVVWRTFSKFGLLSLVGRSKPNKSSAVVSFATATSSASVLVLICSLLVIGSLEKGLLECSDLLIAIILLLQALRPSTEEEQALVPRKGEGLILLKAMEELMKQQFNRATTNRLFPMSLVRAFCFNVPH